jgi:hypothetical protein
MNFHSSSMTESNPNTPVLKSPKTIGFRRDEEATTSASNYKDDMEIFNGTSKALRVIVTGGSSGIG